VLLSAFNTTVLTVALGMLPAQMDTPEARVMLLAIGLQESELTFRCQKNGPAHGCWQFEITGVRSVLSNDACRKLLWDISIKRGITYPSSASIYAALVTDDILAAIVARLLLWTDPKPLPAIGDVQDAWSYYLRNWEPGKPRFDAWPENYARAVSVIQG